MDNGIFQLTFNNGSHCFINQQKHKEQRLLYYLNREKNNINLLADELNHKITLAKNNLNKIASQAKEIHQQFQEGLLKTKDLFNIKFSDNPKLLGITKRKQLNYDKNRMLMGRSQLTKATQDWINLQMLEEKKLVEFENNVKRQLYQVKNNFSRHEEQVLSVMKKIKKELKAYCGEAKEEFQKPNNITSQLISQLAKVQQSELVK